MDSVVDEIVDRVDEVEAEEADLAPAGRGVPRALASARRGEPSLCYSDFKDPSHALLVDAAHGTEHEEAEPTMWSLRDVDKSSNLYLDRVMTMPFAPRKSQQDSRKHSPQPADHDLWRRGSDRSRERVVYCQGHRLVELDAHPTCTSRGWSDSCAYSASCRLRRPTIRRATYRSARFPKFYYCPECRTLDEHGALTSTYGKRCKTCGMALVPSRFIVACSTGTSRTSPIVAGSIAVRRPTARRGLTIEAGGATASLGDIVITCDKCKASHEHGGRLQPGCAQGLVKCVGKRPWLGRTPTRNATRCRAFSNAAPQHLVPDRRFGAVDPAVVGRAPSLC